MGEFTDRKQLTSINILFLLKLFVVNFQFDS